jgi:hypothetical protein
MLLRDLLKRSFLLRRKNVSVRERVDWDLYQRPQFAYGLYHAAREAKALGLPKISAIELGVAGGNGLVAMEGLADEIGRDRGIAIEVFGFDTGKGQPPPQDYRDSPYIWKEGQFKMDEQKLRARLRSARLVIGDVAETTRTFFRDFSPAPIGFISWDLDYYSSTKSAMPLLDERPENYLPRLFCYFDDIVGDDTELHCEFTGELLAIREFNDQHPQRKIAPIHGLSVKRRVPHRWNAKMFVLHRFDHPRYNEFINPKGDWQMPLMASR